MAKNRALFLDRDGVINKDIGYAHRVEQIEFMPGIFDLCREAHGRGELIIVITNQSGIGRGLYEEKDFAGLMGWMRDRFAHEGCPITAVYHCPHVPEDECDCRKPKAGMILRAAEDWSIELSASRLIGDKETDLQAGRAAGVGSCVLAT